MMICYPSYSYLGGMQAVNVGKGCVNEFRKYENIVERIPCPLAASHPDLSGFVLGSLWGPSVVLLGK